MRKILSAACVAAFTLPAFAAWEARLWEGNLSYYDTVHNMTWSDGVRDIGPEQEMFPSWNSRYYSGNFPAAPTLDQLIGLNHARQESDPFLHLTEYGPFHSHVFIMWSSTMAPCKYGPPPTPASCGKVEPGEPFDYLAPYLFIFTPTGDGLYYPYPDDSPYHLVLKGAVGDLGTAIPMPVPEPGTWALLALGMVVVARRARRR